MINTSYMHAHENILDYYVIGTYFYNSNFTEFGSKYEQKITQFIGTHTV